MGKTLLFALWYVTLASAALADADVHECMLIEALDGSFHYNSDMAECSHATAPASTFKIPHALIALETGVVSDPQAVVTWDGTDYPNALWKQDHSLESAIQWSALWFFQRTAALIGNARMLDGLLRLEYSRDSFDGDLTRFWLDGDLQVTPEEQLRFLRQLAANELPVRQAHMDAVKRAMLMPAGKVTLAAGSHPLLLQVPGLGGVYAKTGNAAVEGENVSWLVGFLEVRGRTYVFASRVRSAERLAATDGVALAQAMLNEHLPRQ